MNCKFILITVKIQGASPGSQAQGRSKMTWLDNMTAWTCLTEAHLTRKVEEGQQWRMVVRDVTKHQFKDVSRQERQKKFHNISISSSIVLRMRLYRPRYCPA